MTCFDGYNFMKDESKALDTVLHALCLHPGVTIVSSSLRTNLAGINVSITNAESIIWIEYLCFAANIPSTVFTQTKPVPGESVENSLGRLIWYYRFSGDPDPKYSEEPSNLQIFGEWLIDYLFSLKRIKENEVISLKNELYGG